MFYGKIIMGGPTFIEYLRPEDRKNVNYITNMLKVNDLEVYATGSSLRHPMYDDIDLVVSGGDRSDFISVIDSLKNSGRVKRFLCVDTYSRVKKNEKSILFGSDHFRSSTEEIEILCYVGSTLNWNGHTFEFKREGLKKLFKPTKVDLVYVLNPFDLAPGTEVAKF